MSNFKKEMNMIDKMINQTLCALTMNQVNQLMITDRKI